MLQWEIIVFACRFLLNGVCAMRLVHPLALRLTLARFALCLHIVFALGFSVVTLSSDAQIGFVGPPVVSATVPAYMISGQTFVSTMTLARPFLPPIPPYDLDTVTYAGFRFTDPVSTLLYGNGQPSAFVADVNYLFEFHRGEDTAHTEITSAWVRQWNSPWGLTISYQTAGDALPNTISGTFVLYPSGTQSVASRSGPLSGNQTVGGSDPTFTRWLPLSFSPTANSQVFRNHSGALPAPWGNLNCAYSIALRPESATPNLDLSGVSLFSAPSGNTFKTLTMPNQQLIPAYAITDAPGDRLVFDSNLKAHTDVHSTLMRTMSGYSLTNAGPPGAMKSLGHYTYQFDANGNLLSITDDANNQQTLTYSGNVLTVTDVSSGRSLVFTITARAAI